MKTHSIQFLKTAAALLALSTSTMFAEKKAAITHSFLGVGKANRVVIVGEDGKVRPVDVQKGDKVLFSKYAGSEINMNEEEHLIIREDDVLGILE